MQNVIAILSYNMPHLTDSLYAQMKELVKIPCEIVVFDNGSDDGKAAVSTTHSRPDNTRLTGGLNSILQIVRGVDNVWLCTNDIVIESKIDPLASMLAKIETEPSIGIIHPSLILPVPNYAYAWMIKEPFAPDRTGVTKGHKMVDLICPVYTKATLDAMDWQFDPRWSHGWGIDYDSCLIARNVGLDVAVDFDLLVRHHTSVTYDSGNDHEFKNRHEYYNKAMEVFSQGMSDKYGHDWMRFF